MPRRAKPKPKKRDWRWFVSTGLNAFVALSMVLGTVFLFSGGSLAPRAAPATFEAPTDLPTFAPTTPAITPTPAVAPTSTPPSAPNPAPSSPTPGSNVGN